METLAEIINAVLVALLCIVAVFALVCSVLHPLNFCLTIPMAFGAYVIAKETYKEYKEK